MGRRWKRALFLIRPLDLDRDPHLDGQREYSPTHSQRIPVTGRLAFSNLAAVDPLSKTFHGCRASGSRAPNLVFTQGFRHLKEYALQGAAFGRATSSLLVAKADLLMHSNNARHNWTELMHALGAYPHRCRALVRTSANSGYRCGHLDAIRQMREIWSQYQLALFLHPDILLTPQAHANLSRELAAHPDAAFLVTQIGPTTKGQVFVHWPNFGTDLFLFRPPLLPEAAFANISCGRSAGPEVALRQHVTNDLRLTHHILSTRAAGFHAIDELGLWHAHPPQLNALALREYVSAPSHLSAWDHAPPAAPPTPALLLHSGYSGKAPCSAPSLNVCFQGQTDTARYCGNFWHEVHGSFLPAFLKLYALGLLCPSTQVRFSIRCSKFLRPLLGLFVNTSSPLGSICGEPAGDITLAFDTAPVEYYGRKFYADTGIDGGLFKCLPFSFNNSVDVRHVHVAAAQQLGVPPRTARPLTLLLNFRGSEQHKRRIRNQEAVSGTLMHVAHEYGSRFVVINSGTMTLTEQVRAFASADVIVMYHGSANIWAFWMPSDAVFVEIQPGSSWHCANAYNELQLIYILATADGLTTQPGSCPSDLVKRYRCGQPGGTCPGFELERQPPLRNHRWQYHRENSRNVSVLRLSQLTHAILQSYQNVREHPDRLSVSPALAQMTSSACLGKARSFERC
jgi:hypothetical protein